MASRARSGGTQGIPAQGCSPEQEDKQGSNSRKGCPYAAYPGMICIGCGRRIQVRMNRGDFFLFEILRTVSPDRCFIVIHIKVIPEGIFLRAVFQLSFSLNDFLHEFSFVFRRGFGRFVPGKKMKLLPDILFRLR